MCWALTSSMERALWLKALRTRTAVLQNRLPEVQTAHAVSRVVLLCENQNRKVRLFAVQLAHKVLAVNPWKIQVQHEQVVVGFCGECPRLLMIMAYIYSVVFCFKPLAYETGNRNILSRNQNMHDDLGEWEMKLFLSAKFAGTTELRARKAVPSPERHSSHCEPIKPLTAGSRHRRIMRNRMTLWTKAALKSVFVPGGFMLALAAFLIHEPWIPLSPGGLTFFYYSVFVAALALSLRFRSLRIIFGTILLLLAHYALTAKGSALHPVQGKMASEAVALLVPLDFILLTFIPERNLTRQHFVGISAVLFFQSTFVAVFARPDQPDWSGLHLSFVHSYPLRLPQPALVMFLIALGILLWRVLRFRKAIDHGMFWSLLAVFMALEAGGVSRQGTTYFAISGLILASSIVESSYSLAYRDELTGLHSRRAFNDVISNLKHPCAVAAVDIDHFKSINDTYGHDTGDQVLRLVASRLANVSGGGNAYRVGGEEFTILFPGKNSEEIFQHLELLRMNIESCSFRLRRGEDRRKSPRDGERRTAAKAQPTKRTNSGALSVTVSIGIAESRPRAAIEQIIELADKALYTAKQSGRNRIEIASGERKGRKTRTTSQTS